MISMTSAKNKKNIARSMKRRFRFSTLTASGLAVALLAYGTFANAQTAYTVVAVPHEVPAGGFNFTPVTSFMEGAMLRANIRLDRALVTPTGQQAQQVRIVVSYETQDGTAKAGEDYTGVTGTTTFTPGSAASDNRVKNITFTGIQDSRDEDDETLSLVITSVSATGVSAVIGTSSSQEVTITDNDNPPTVSIRNLSPTGDEGAELSFSVDLSVASGKTVTVTYNTSGVTATAGEDYTALLNQMLTFQPGETTKVIAVATTDDPTDEDNTETLTLTISNPSNATLGSTTATTGTINDNDPAPVVSFQAAEVFAAEGNALVFPVTLSRPSSRVVTIDFSTSDGTAKAGADYTARVNQALTFQPGETSKEVRVSTTADTTAEPNQSMTISLSNPSASATIQGAVTRATGTITEPSILSVALGPGQATSVTEAETAVFTITSSNTEAQAVVVPLTVSETGKALAGTAPTSVTLPANGSSVELTLAFDDDDSDENDSSITVTLGNPDPRAYALGTASATLTVTDNDNEPTLSIPPATTNEGSPLLFVLRLSNPSDLSISVTYRTEDGEAKADNDYTAVSAGLTFASGETERVVTVNTLRDDESGEDDETLSLVLTSATNADLGGAEVRATGTIIEGISNEQVRQLNEAILPHIAAAIADTTSRAVRGRAANAFNGNQAQGLALQGASFSQFIASQARGAANQHSRFNAGPGQAMPPPQWAAPYATGTQPSPASGSWDPRSLGFADTAFSMALNWGGDDSAQHQGLTIWGRGHHTDLSVDGKPASFDGNISGGLIGVDLLRSNLLFGLALNRAVADIDWNNESLTGNHETTLTGIHPYIVHQWDNGIHLWGTLGFERGETEISEDGRANELCEVCKFDVELTTIALGTYGLFYESTMGSGNLRVGYIGDGSYSRFKQTSHGDVSVNTSWLRAGVELDYRRDLTDNSSFGSTLEATWRFDRGDARRGSGLELGGGVNVDLPHLGLRFDLEVRTLLAHHNDEVDEWGISGGVSWSLQPDGRGLFLSFKPQWGTTSSAQQALWEHGLSDFLSREAAAGRYNLELRYGLPILQGRELLTLFARNQFESAGQSTSLGADLKLGRYFSSGYEAILRTGDTGTNHAGTDQRVYIRYERKLGL